MGGLAREIRALLEMGAGPAPPGAWTAADDATGVVAEAESRHIVNLVELVEAVDGPADPIRLNLARIGAVLPLENVLNEAHPSHIVPIPFGPQD